MIQTDISLSYTVDAINQSDKSLICILKINQMNLKYQNIINTKKNFNKKIFNMKNNKVRKKIIYFFFEKMENIHNFKKI